MGHGFHRVRPSAVVKGDDGGDVGAYRRERVKQDHRVAPAGDGEHVPAWWQRGDRALHFCDDSRFRD